MSFFKSILILFFLLSATFAYSDNHDQNQATTENEQLNEIAQEIQDEDEVPLNDPFAGNEGRYLFQGEGDQRNNHRLSSQTKRILMTQPPKAEGVCVQSLKDLCMLGQLIPQSLCVSSVMLGYGFPRAKFCFQVALYILRITSERPEVVYMHFRRRIQSCIDASLGRSASDTSTCD